MTTKQDVLDFLEKNEADDYRAKAPDDIFGRGSFAGLIVGLSLGITLIDALSKSPERQGSDTVK